MSPTITDLPPEILSEIVTHFDVARSLLNFSLTCKRFHSYVENDGFRIFVLRRFPSFPTPPHWKEAVHALTTLSRAWDRKAFVARCIRPEQHLPTLVRQDRFHHHARHWQQTMGYQPVIDCYEQWTAPAWASREEILAWGAGSELIIRIKRMGDGEEKLWQGATYLEQEEYDQHHHRISWLTYREDWYTDGQDDITFVNVLRPGQRHADGFEHVLIGRANGNLERRHLSRHNKKANAITQYITQNRTVRSAHVSTTPEPLLAACLADNSLALYSVNSTTKDSEPRDEIQVMPLEQSGRTWSTKFLRHNLIAIGMGPSLEPIRIFEVLPGGISTEPIRRFRIFDTASDGRVETENSLRASLMSSVYPIVPIGPSSQAGGAEGEIFLSGGFDGNVRLHDLRSPGNDVGIYSPVADDAAVYSLLPFGRERVVVGTAQNRIMRVFDLRMAGGKVYYAADLDEISRASWQESVTHTHEAASGELLSSSKNTTSNYSLYLNSYAPDRSYRRNVESSIYSLAAASPFSPTFYAGLESAVVQIDVTSMMDKFPDPIFKHGIKPGSLGSTMKKWSPYSEDRKVFNLAMVGVDAKGNGLHVNQMDTPHSALFLPKWERLPGLDERWIKPRRDRWDEPPNAD